MCDNWNLRYDGKLRKMYSFLNFVLYKLLKKERKEFEIVTKFGSQQAIHYQSISAKGVVGLSPTCEVF